MQDVPESKLPQFIIHSVCYSLPLLNSTPHTILSAAGYNHRAPLLHKFKFEKVRRLLAVDDGMEETVLRVADREKILKTPMGNSNLGPGFKFLIYELGPAQNRPSLGSSLGSRNRKAQAPPSALRIYVTPATTPRKSSRATWPSVMEWEPTRLLNKPLFSFPSRLCDNRFQRGVRLAAFHVDETTGSIHNNPEQRFTGPPRKVGGKSPKYIVLKSTATSADSAWTR
ncbi:hypothetical protein C8F01DRAFT_1231455 [Mycena amicta]|nr:hypothetical protein C8F01DRAFT_1231455 [Mycena amicta]